MIARKVKPMGRLTAVEPKSVIRFGVLKGKVKVADDFDDPLPGEVLAGFEGHRYQILYSSLDPIFPRSQSMIPQPLPELYTLEDYRHWEGDWELIHGMPLAMAPSPGLQHQRLGMRIARQLDEALDDCPHCEALFGIDVEFSQDTLVRPDVILICYQPEGERLTRAPDLIFEVISPATARRDEQTKFQLYRDEGVTWYVLVYPAAAKAKVYRLVDGDYRKVGDFYDERQDFELSRCTIAFDFGRLWRERGAADSIAP